MKTPESATDNNVGRKVPDNVPETNVGKINGRTPEETKKGLEYCYSAKPCVDCSYDKRDFPHCVRRLLGDAINEYNALESRLAQAERERDAAVRAISIAQHYIKDLGAVQYGLQQLENWDYELKRRGVCPENAKEESK